MATEAIATPEIGPMESEETGIRRAKKKVLGVELLGKAIAWEDIRDVASIARAALRKHWNVDGDANNEAEAKAGEVDEMGGIHIGDIYQQPQPQKSERDSESKLADLVETAKTAGPSLLTKLLVGGALVGGGSLLPLLAARLFDRPAAEQAEFVDTDTDTKYKLELVD